MAAGEEARDDEGTDPERELRRRVALARIRQYPDPALRLRAAEVEIFDADLDRLIERMTALMQEAVGVGLAGNQVGVLQRLFVFVQGDDPRAIVNPVIASRSQETEVDEEGCLSLQGVHVSVERPTSVVLEGQDPRGRTERLELEGLPARVVQHELDHLDGVLIIDRTTPEQRREALATLRPKPALSLR